MGIMPPLIRRSPYIRGGDIARLAQQAFRCAALPVMLNRRLLGQSDRPRMPLYLRYSFSGHSRKRTNTLAPVHGGDGRHSFISLKRRITRRIARQRLSAFEDISPLLDMRRRRMRRHDKRPRSTRFGRRYTYAGLLLTRICRSRISFLIGHAAWMHSAMNSGFSPFQLAARSDSPPLTSAHRLSAPRFDGARLIGGIGFAFDIIMMTLLRCGMLLAAHNMALLRYAPGL